LKNVLLRVAIDGGAGTGKSTISKNVANKLGITYINTGQMYRLIALFAYKNNLIDNENILYEKIKNMKVSFDKNGLITSNLISFSPNDLESNEISSIVSIVASYEKIREVSTIIQKEISKQKGILLEGRDIGTIIMPDADYKFYLEVNPEIAAKRRVIQHKKQGINSSYDSILKNINKRNDLDKNRKIGPLMKAFDSKTIDTSNNTIDEIVHQILEVING